MQDPKLTNDSQIALEEAYRDKKTRFMQEEVSHTDFSKEDNGDDQNLLNYG
jgi:hypothetical protein